MLWMNINTFSILTKHTGEGENCAHDKELSFIFYLGSNTKQARMVPYCKLVLSFLAGHFGSCMKTLLNEDC